MVLRRDNGGLTAKRVFDLSVGAVLLLAAFPLIIVLAMAQAASLRCWPFFSHERVGLHGRPFRFYKLRTLPASTAAYADKYDIRRIRLPALSRFLRSKHLDELPQLLLVVLGKMSLVGPRPEMKYLHEAGEPSFAVARVGVRPGCTGLWQTSADQGGLIWEATKYDVYYLRNGNGRLDLWILCRTVLLMMRRG